MNTTYFRQTMQLLRQNSFISIISIAGTALAIMMIMSLIVTSEIQNASIGAEKNRYRTMYISSFKITNDNNWTQNRPSKTLYRDKFAHFKSAETVSLFQGSDKEKIQIQTQDYTRNMEGKLSITDGNYWRIMTHTFVKGAPYTQQDFESGIQKAVLSESSAGKLFGTRDPVGEVVLIDFKPYTVTGVVKDVPRTFTYASADVWATFDEYNDSGQLLFLAHDKKGMKDIVEEVRKSEGQYAYRDGIWNLSLLGPYTHAQANVVSGFDFDENPRVHTRKMIFIFCLLMLVPALNLSGFSLSRIRRRTEEIGIRKAFGAKKYAILYQVLYENFITSLIGGIIGLILSYAVVMQLKEWLLETDSSTALPLGALVSPSVFLAVFVLCFVLNLLSAGLPALRASRMNIVDSLKQKNN